MTSLLADFIFSKKDVKRLLVPKLEKSIGIEVYATDSLGIRGQIRQRIEDFIVEEVLVDGSRAKIKTPDSFGERSVLGSSTVKNRYLLCVLVKRNWDTLASIRKIAEQLCIDSRRIQIAGLKDAKAATAQHITIERANVEQVEKVNVKDLCIHPIGYVHHELSPYYSRGNSFRIVISSLRLSKTALEKRIAGTFEQLNEIGGAPNFYGHQRFGTTRSITHLIGREIVNGNLKKAATLFLAKPSLHEHPSSRKARQELRSTQDFKKAFTMFPKQLRYEKMMLGRLLKRQNDFIEAFRALPVKLLELFVQAYQSYLFNKSLTRRIESGLPLNEAVVGDHVIGVERSGLPMQTVHKIVTAETRSEINKALRAGKMRLALPVVGFRQQLSQGAQGEIEKQILEDDNISQQSFKVSALPETASRGELRTCIMPVRDLSYDVSDDSVGMRFTLFRGSYATIVLREVMKPRNPIAAGF